MEQSEAEKDAGKPDVTAKIMLKTNALKKSQEETQKNPLHTATKLQGECRQECHITIGQGSTGTGEVL